MSKIKTKNPRWQAHDNSFYCILGVLWAFKRLITGGKLCLRKSRYIDKSFALHKYYSATGLSFHHQIPSQSLFSFISDVWFSYKVNARCVYGHRLGNIWFCKSLSRMASKSVGSMQGGNHPFDGCIKFKGGQWTGEAEIH